ncbi:hypothetical protein ACSBR2_019439 [Camellia fascicularis]
MHFLPLRPFMALAREAAEMVMFVAIDNIFNSTNTKPKYIDIVVVNYSLFNSTTSLSAMIVSKYKLKLRGNIRTFNLGGMGCSAGVIAIDLAKDMLQVHRNTYTVVVTKENITQNWYFGNKKSMLTPNCLFRLGGATVLLLNKTKDHQKANYKLIHVVRTHCGANDQAFRCLLLGKICDFPQDDKSKTSVSLSKGLTTTVGQALKTNIKTLGPLVLPITKQFLFFMSIIKSKLLNEKTKPYIPDFKLAFEHFCIHARGKAVIDELEKKLQLLPIHVEASRMTLHRFGNTSSSSICAMWETLRNVKPSHHSPWADCIHNIAHLVLFLTDVPLKDVENDGNYNNDHCQEDSNSDSDGNDDLSDRDFSDSSDDDDPDLADIMFDSNVERDVNEEGLKEGHECYINDGDSSKKQVVTPTVCDDKDNNNKPKYPEFRPEVDMQNIEFKLEMLFSNINEFKDVVKEHAVKEGHDVKVTKSEKWKVQVNCSAGCEWKLYACKMTGENTL